MRRRMTMMMTYVVVGGLVILVLVSLGWRVASRRRSLPCPAWLRLLVELDNPFTKVNRARAIAANLDLQPGMQVLDVGCGPGRVSIPVAKLVAPGEVVAMDLQPGMLLRVREKAELARLGNVRLLEAAAGEGKVATERFDRALMVTVLGEIPDQLAALREVFGALKPGGLLSVTEVVFDPHFQLRGTVRRLAAAAGFHEKRFLGGPLAYTLVLEKSGNASQDTSTSTPPPSD
jgi:ubiquinone/menaquinone biosynthesis C-methylase UbiE